MSDGAVHQYAVTTQFHGDSRVGCRAYTRINNDRYCGIFQDHHQVVGVANAKP